MSRQEKRGREGLGLLWSRIPKGGAFIPTQRPSCGPAFPSYPGLSPSSSQRGRPGPASHASTHRSLPPHSSQQWPLLVISRADGCGRDSQRSPGPMLQLSPRRLPPRAGARLPTPLPTAAAWSSKRTQEPSPQPRLRAGVRASACGSARACSRGSPRSPAERRGRGEGSSLRALRCGASSARRSAPHVLVGVPRAPDHPGSQHWQSRAPEACVCCGRLRGRGGGRQGRPHVNLGTCSQSAKRSSPRESWRGLELQQAKASPARSCSPRRRAKADPAVPGRRRGARPPAPRAHCGDKARIGGWLAAGAPAAPRSAVRGAETTLSARSLASSAAEESIIQSFATASSSPSASL